MMLVSGSAALANKLDARSIGEKESVCNTAKHC